jgi:hypothetical protein
VRSAARAQSLRALCGQAVRAAASFHRERIDQTAGCQPDDRGVRRSRAQRHPRLGRDVLNDRVPVLVPFGQTRQHQQSRRGPSTQLVVYSRPGFSYACRYIGGYYVPRYMPSIVLIAAKLRSGPDASALALIHGPGSL